MDDRRQTTSPGIGWRGKLIAPAFLILVSALFFRGVLRGECFYALDFHQTFEPLRAILAESLHEGLPLWSGRLGNGAPILGDPLHAALYPPNLLFALAPGPTTLTILTVLHLVLGAAGAWFLARAWGLRPSGAWGAAVLFGFGGATVSATAFANLCWSQAWLPWLILAWEGATRPGRHSRGWATLRLAAVIALMTTLGEPFLLLAGLLAVLTLTAADALAMARRPGGGWLRLIVPPAVALLLAFLLALPFVVAFLSYVPGSMRGLGFTAEGVTQWSLHPGFLLEFVAPGLFGDPDLEGLRAFWAQALVPEKGFPLFRGFYVGGLAAALALVGAVRGPRRKGPMLVWLLLLALLALGRYGPLYGMLAGLPLLDSLRFPMKWALPALLPLSILVGAGIDGVGIPGRARISRGLPLLAVVSSLVLLAALGLASLPGWDGWIDSLAERPHPVSPSAGNAGATVVLARGSGLDEAGAAAVRSRVRRAALRAALPLALAAALLVVGSNRSTRFAAGGLALLLTMDLGLANPKLAPTVSRSFYDEVPPVVRVLRQEPKLLGRVWTEDPWAAGVRLVPPPERFVDRSRWQRRALMGYVGASFGLEPAFHKDTAMIAPVPYTRLGVLLKSAPPREKLMLLGAAGVSHLVTFRDLQHPSLEPLAVISGPTDLPQRVWRNGLAVPRIRLVPTLLPHDGDAGFIAAVRSGPDDLFRRVALVDEMELRERGVRIETLPPPKWDGPPDPVGQARVTLDRGGRLRIRTTGRGGFLVVSDCHVPGWNAEVDGAPAPLLRVDCAFRAVPVPAGEHEVRMRYEIW